MCEVVRSPANVCWRIMWNGTQLDTADTKAEAEDIKRFYDIKIKRMGL